MNYSGMPAGMWMLFKKHFRKALVGDLGYDYTEMMHPRNEIGSWIEGLK